MGADTLAKSIAVLARYEGLNREQARTFISRCTRDEQRRLAECENEKDFAEVMDEILQRQDAADAWR
jgi:hypothetical protein